MVPCSIQREDETSETSNLQLKIKFKLINLTMKKIEREREINVKFRDSNQQPKPSRENLEV